MDADELLERYAKGERDFQKVDLKNVDLRGAELREIDLSYSDLSGANLRGVDLSKANLTGAKIQGIDLSRASLVEANLSLLEGSAQYYNYVGGGLQNRVNLMGANLYYANLSEATLSGADLSITNFERANLSNAKLSSANFSKAHLLEANLNSANLNYADMTQANLIRADLSKAELAGANFKDANLQSAKLQSVKLNGLDLSGLNLTNADLNKARFENTNLRGACLQGANLEKTVLQKADLMKANLTAANLKKADLTDAKTYKTLFDDADLTGAIMPDGEVYIQKGLERVISMDRKVIFTESAPSPVGPYNQAILASGQMLFVAGQIAIDPRLGDVVYKDDITKQTERVMANIEAILTAAGAKWSNVVKTSVFLANMNDFAAMNAVYSKYFDEATAPARACVEVSRLPKDVLVEIECIAMI